MEFKFNVKTSQVTKTYKFKDYSEASREQAKWVKKAKKDSTIIEVSGVEIAKD